MKRELVERERERERASTSVYLYKLRKMRYVQEEVYDKTKDPLR